MERLQWCIHCPNPWRWRRSWIERRSSVFTGQSTFPPSPLVTSFGWWAKEWDHGYKQTKWVCSVGWLGKGILQDRLRSWVTSSQGEPKVLWICPTSLTGWAGGADWDPRSLGISGETVDPESWFQRSSWRWIDGWLMDGQKEKTGVQTFCCVQTKILFHNLASSRFST